MLGCRIGSTGTWAGAPPPPATDAGAGAPPPLAALAAAANWVGAVGAVCVATLASEWKPAILLSNTWVEEEAPPVSAATLAL